MTRADALGSAARTEVECWQESALNIQRDVLGDFSRFAVALTTSSATVAFHQTSNSVNEQHQRGSGDRHQRTGGRSHPKAVGPVLSVAEHFRPVDHRRLPYNAIFIACEFSAVLGTRRLIVVKSCVRAALQRLGMPSRSKAVSIPALGRFEGALNGFRRPWGMRAPAATTPLLTAEQGGGIVGKDGY